MEIVEYTTEEDFDRIWKPQTRANGELFSYSEVVSIAIKNVWTVYEDESVDEDGSSDNNWYAMPGISAGVALGYLVTGQAWSEDSQHAIWYLDVDVVARAERCQHLSES